MNNKQVTAETITPQRAAQLLERNVRNRKLDDSTVRKYVMAMEEGRWVPLASQISLGDDGVLLDGQRRLSAVIKSGIAQQFVMVRGLPDEAQDNMDTQKRRTAGGQFQITGESSGSALAAAVKVAARYDLGARGAAIFSSNELAGYPKGYPDMGQAREFLEEHPELRDSVRYGARLRKIGVSGQVASLFAWLFQQVALDPEVEEFYQALASGAGLASDSPIFVLREKLIASRNDKRSTRPKEIVAAEIIKAWNCWREGRRATPATIRWRTGGENAEKFPTVR